MAIRAGASSLLNYIIRDGYRLWRRLCRLHGTGNTKRTLK